MHGYPQFAWRPAVVLLAAAAVLALVMPAGASTGTAQISPEQAGSTATGAQFKTIDARVFLRQPTQYAGEVASFGHSVQLWSSGLPISGGLTASTAGGGHHKLLANTGQQSGSDWVAVPADLSSGGASFQTFFLPQSAHRDVRDGRP